MEEWRDIKGYEGYYQVSNLGNVRSLDRYILREGDKIPRFIKGKNMTKLKNSDGYFQCKLSKDGISKTLKIHRLVAEAFIPNPNNLEEVNHINTQRDDNNVDNLEWINHKNNILHSKLKNHYSHFGKSNSRSRKITLLSINREPIKDFDSIRECCYYLKDVEELETNINSIYDSLYKKLNGKSQTAYLNKYYFKFANC